MKNRKRSMILTIGLMSFLSFIFWVGGNIQPTPETIVDTSRKDKPIQAQEVPITKVIPKVEPKYGFTPDDIYLLTVLLCGSSKKDGDGEYDFDFEDPRNQQQISLVLNVVMNRVNSKEFPDTVSKVIWQKNQFSYMYHWKKRLPRVKDSSYEVVKAWCDAYDAYDTSVITIPTNHIYFSGNGVINKSRAR